MLTVQIILSETDKMGRLKVSEVFCFICRGVLIEPVTLPCFHVFCYSCFEQSMQETSYSCPLCRKRISNWVRSSKKSNNLINQKLWAQIKEQFNNEVSLKLNGEDDGLDQCIQEEFSASASTSKPGEVAQEFSKFYNDFKNEIDKIKEAEELASKEYIIKLRQEEERQLQILKESNISRIQEDSMLAMKIQEEINKEISSPKPSEISKKSDRKNKRHNHQKNMEKPLKGPMDDFLTGMLGAKSIKENNISGDSIKENSGLEDSIVKRSTSTDSTDSIRLEINLFKPIKTAHTTPPKQYPDGRFKEINLTKVTPLKLNFSNSGSSCSNTSIIEGRNIHSSHSAFVDTNTLSHETQDDFESPLKRLRFISDDIDNSVLKDITLGDNMETGSGATLQDDLTKKRINSLRKSTATQENLDAPSKIPKFGLDLNAQGRMENGNDIFETQDYVDFDPSIEERIIEEQRKIENMILQEKKDRELALKLSREWESESNEKPQTRSMKAAAVKNAKNTGDRHQQTIEQSIAGRTRNRK